MGQKDLNMALEHLGDKARSNPNSWVIPKSQFLHLKMGAIVGGCDEKHQFSQPTLRGPFCGLKPAMRIEHWRALSKTLNHIHVTLHMYIARCESEHHLRTKWGQGRHRVLV